MGKENGVEEATTSNSLAAEQNQHMENQQNNVTPGRVPFYKLFSFADSTDKALMIIGSIGAVGNGVCMPLMAIIFGELVDSFGENQNTKHIIHVVSQVNAALMSIFLKITHSIYLALSSFCFCAILEMSSKMLNFCTIGFLQVSLKFVYLAIGVAIAAFLRKHSKSHILCSNIIE